MRVCEYAIRRESGEKSKRYGVGSSLLNILYAEGGTPLSHVTARYGGLCASLQRNPLLMGSVVSRDSVPYFSTRARPLPHTDEPPPGPSSDSFRHPNSPLVLFHKAPTLVSAALKLFAYNTSLIAIPARRRVKQYGGGTPIFFIQ